MWKSEEVEVDLLWFDGDKNPVGGAEDTQGCAPSPGFDEASFLGGPPCVYDRTVRHGLVVSVACRREGEGRWKMRKRGYPVD